MCKKYLIWDDFELEVEIISFENVSIMYADNSTLDVITLKKNRMSFKICMDFWIKMLSYI